MSSAPRISSTERGDEGVAKIKDLTHGLGAHERRRRSGRQFRGDDAAGNRSTRPGGHVGFVGVPHGADLPGERSACAGDPPARRPRACTSISSLRLIDLITRGEIEPGKVLDLALPLAQVAEAYRAMDERRSIKALLRP